MSYGLAESQMHGKCEAEGYCKIQNMSIYRCLRHANKEFLKIQFLEIEFGINSISKAIIVMVKYPNSVNSLASQCS